MHKELIMEDSTFEIVENEERTGGASLSGDPLENIFLKPIRPRRAFEEVSDEIKLLIFKGQLKVGDKLPPENKLASRFKVGRQTIREALRYLEMAGFIETVKGSCGGTVVIDTVLHSICNSLLDAIQLRRISLHEMIVARLELERTVLKHVLACCDEEDIELLRQNVTDAMKRIDNRKMAFHENLRFHKILAEISKNYVFVLMMETITMVMADFLSRRQSNLRIARRVVTEHGELVEAIAARNEKEAFEALERHLLSIEKHLQVFQKDRIEPRFTRYSNRTI